MIIAIVTYTIVVPPMSFMYMRLKYTYHPLCCDEMYSTNTDCQAARGERIEYSESDRADDLEEMDPETMEAITRSYANRDAHEFFDSDDSEYQQLYKNDIYENMEIHEGADYYGSDNSDNATSDELRLRKDDYGSEWELSPQ